MENEIEYESECRSDESFIRGEIIRDSRISICIGIKNSSR